MQRQRDLTEVPQNRRRARSRMESKHAGTIHDDTTPEGLRAAHRETQADVRDLQRRWEEEMPSDEGETPAPSPPPSGGMAAFKCVALSNPAEPGEHYGSGAMTCSLNEMFNLGGGAVIGGGNGDDYIEFVQHGIWRITLALQVSAFVGEHATALLNIVPHGVRILFHATRTVFDTKHLTFPDTLERSWGGGNVTELFDTNELVDLYGHARLAPNWLLDADYVPGIGDELGIFSGELIYPYEAGPIQPQ